MNIMGFSNNDRKTVKHLSTFLGVLEFIAETSPFLGGRIIGVMGDFLRCSMGLFKNNLRIQPKNSGCDEFHGKLWKGGFV